MAAFQPSMREIAELLAVVLDDETTERVMVCLMSAANDERLAEREAYRAEWLLRDLMVMRPDVVEEAQQR